MRNSEFVSGILFWVGLISFLIGFCFFFTKELTFLVFNVVGAICLPVSLILKKRAKSDK